jgi:PAS domain S-box-containing protein
MNIEKKKILVVEDEFITLADLVGNLEQMGFIVPASTDTGEEVLDLAIKYEPDLILLDINLKGDMTGIAAAEKIRENLDIPIVFLTGQSDEATISRAIKSEPFGYIIKPFEERSLKTAISMALYKHSIDQQVKASEIRYRKIAESSDYLIAILTSEYSIEYINPAGLALFQKNFDDVVNMPLQNLISSDAWEEVFPHIQSVIDSSENWRDHILIDIAGQKTWLDLTISPISYTPSTPMQLLVIAHDISNWVFLQKEIEKEGISRIEKNMEQFQILNDQIRNPLTVIATYVSMDEGPFSDKINESVKIIDDLVTQLDKGWIESEKVRSFLLRHYRHGEKL